MRAVVVTETLDWRLHGLDLMTEHMATGDLPLMSASWMVGAQYKPSEIAKCEWSVIQQGPPWAVDSWGLGCLMQVSYFLLSWSQLSQTQAWINPSSLHVWAVLPLAFGLRSKCNTRTNRRYRHLHWDSGMCIGILEMCIGILEMCWHTATMSYLKSWGGCSIYVAIRATVSCHDCCLSPLAYILVHRCRCAALWPVNGLLHSCITRVKGLRITTIDQVKCNCSHGLTDTQWSILAVL